MMKSFHSVYRARFVRTLVVQFVKAIVLVKCISGHA